MPSGGTWTEADLLRLDQRPGLYAIFKNKAAQILAVGEAGIVAIPVTADWGPLRIVTTIESETALIAAFGPSTLLGSAYYGIRETLRGGAKTILAYRMAGAAAAKAVRILQDATAGTAITLTAKYEGVRANGFTIDVVTNPINGAAKDVKISEAGVLLETFTGTTNALIAAAINAVDGTGSKYVVAVVGGGTFVANVAGAPMTGGDSGLTVLAADYTAAMAALEPSAWDVFAAVSVTDTGITASIAAWIIALRAGGNKVIGVFGSALTETLTAAKARALTFNDEGIVYSWPGVTDAAGVVRSGADFAGRIAGLIASKGVNKSLTFARLSLVNALEFMPTNAEVKAALASGVLMITTDGAGNFRVEQGLNTLTTYDTDQSKAWRKIRIVRILDSIFNSITRGINESYIGQIENNADGQATVLASIRSFLESLSAGDLIEPEFTVEMDPGHVSAGDQFFVLIGVKPVDSVDYIYLTINVEA